MLIWQRRRRAVTDSPRTPAFPNYLQVPAQGPAALWWLLRLITMAAVVGLCARCVLNPEAGLRLFWTVVIPLLPVLFAFAPGLWRQVCPLALANQIPRTFGFSRAIRLPAPLKRAAPLIAATLFFVLVSLRPISFSVNAGMLLALIGATLLLAFAGGVAFAGRSGWCGTFCPLAPIQRVYGLAPVVKVRNGYCESCLGCQKNCYDFNPRAAFVADFQDNDSFYVSQRRLFTAALPGFVLGFFASMLVPAIESNMLLFYAALVATTIFSIGAYTVIQTYTRVPEVHLSAVFGQGALIAFYALTAGPLVETLALYIPGLAAIFWLDEALITAVVGCSGVVLYRHLRTHHAFTNQADDAPSEAPKLTVDVGRIPTGAQDAPSLVEVSSGQTMDANPAASLLETFEGAGIKLDYGCRMGMCGADPVAVIEGDENLSPPSEEELASLRRLGLEGRARLACVCKVQAGRAVVDLSTDPKTLPPPVSNDEAPEDPAPRAGVSRVVIVGNGAAGTTAATELRRLSPSVEIDIIAEEPHPFYNRMGIGRLIHRDEGAQTLYMLDTDAHDQAQIKLHQDTRAMEIKKEVQSLRLSTGESLKYDRLVLATGAQARVPSVEGRDRPGVFVLRTLADAEAVRAYVRELDLADPRAVVVGGGVLGVEAADAVSRLGVKTHILQRGDRLMQRELDGKGADILNSFLSQTGVKVLTGADFEGIEGEEDTDATAGRARAVVLGDGRRVPADVVLICAGVVPDVALARSAGLKIDNGILVDGDMATSDPSIFAVGDAAQTKPASPALWPIGTQHGARAAAAILGTPAPTAQSPIYVRLKHDGVCVFSFGSFHRQEDGDVEIVSPADRKMEHRRVLLRDGVLVAALAVGAPGADKPLLPYLSGQTIPEALIKAWQNDDWDA